MGKHDLARDILQRALRVRERSLNLWLSYQMVEPTEIAAEQVSYYTQAVERLKRSLAVLDSDEPPTPGQHIASVSQLTDHRRKKELQ